MIKVSPMKLIRQTAHYKIGYLLGAMQLAVQMLKNGATEEAITRLEDTLKTIKGVEDEDTL